MQIFQLPEIAKLYPKAKISMLPILNFDYFSLSVEPSNNISYFINNGHFTYKGRTALYEALRLSHASANSEVLIPSYHCGSMVEPVLHVGADPVFYALNNDLTVNIESVKDKISANTKAILIPHYFGFLQPLDDLCSVLDGTAIKIIEDCAHSFYGHPEANYLPGERGDFAICSTAKFFPGSKGGLLAIKEPRDEALELKRPGVLECLRDVKQIIETRQLFNRSVLPDCLSTMSTSNNGFEVQTSRTRDIGRNNYLWFNPSEIGLSNSSVNIFLSKHVNHHAIVQKRISNYQYYLELFKGLDGVRFLHEDLGSTVPYVFPLILDNPKLSFHQLKLLGVPIWRWEELVVNLCPTANDYRYQLLQLPCHHSISNTEIEWIFSCFSYVLNNCN